MKTATAAIAITCPDWCEIDPQDHAKDLGELDGACIHRTSELLVEDPTGWRNDMLDDKPKSDGPIRLDLSASTAPNGNEMSSPFISIEGQQVTIAQAKRLVDEISKLIELYDASFGDGFDAFVSRWQKEEAARRAYAASLNASSTGGR